MNISITVNLEDALILAKAFAEGGILVIQNRQLNSTQQEWIIYCPEF